MSYLEERLYSEAFEEGFNYAVEKMFARKFINPKNISNQRITRKGKGDVFSWDGDAFYKKVKSMQPNTFTINDIDNIKLPHSPVPTRIKIMD